MNRAQRRKVGAASNPPGLPRIVPGEESSYYATGDGALVLKAEFSRTVTVTCQACKVTAIKLKLLTDVPLTPQHREQLLTNHLDGLGWGRLKDRGADICPDCFGTKHDICPHCRLYTGGHTKTCPTQIPGSLL